MDTAITKRVEQITIEDSYSRINIRANVKQAILDMTSEEGVIYDIFAATQSAILGYLTGDYYESKNKRIAHIMDITSEDLALEVMIAVLPVTRKSPVQSIATRLANQLGYDNVFDGVRTAAELLGACAKTGLYQVWLNPITIQATVSLPADVMTYIEKTQYMNPMVCQPVNWTDNNNGGYISVCQSVILGKHNRHDKKQAVDALNIAQSVEWELDMQMVNYIEKPKNTCTTKQQIDGHIRQTNSALDVYQDLVDQGNSFYFVWRFDFRGRMYTQGYFVNLQSTDYKKSILNFKHQQIIKG